MTKRANTRLAAVISLAGLLLAAGVLAACSSSDSGTKAPTPTATATGPLTIASDAFAADGPLPPEYTCSGAGVSPPLHWSAIPEGTQTLALIVEDPDAPIGVVDHWVVFDVPTETRGFAPSVRPGPILHGGKQGNNVAGKDGWQPACPPPGSTPHHYHFQLYAVDTMLNLAEGATKAQVKEAMTGHIVGQAEIVATFSR